MQGGVSIFCLTKPRRRGVVLGLVMTASGVCTDTAVYPEAHSKLVELERSLPKCIFLHWECKSH